MLISDDARRLCDISTSIYRFTICLHDGQGKLLMMFPALDPDYVEEYRVSGMYEQLALHDADTLWPKVITNRTTDIWAGFPILYQDGALGFLTIGPVFFSDLSEKALHAVLDTSRAGTRTRQLFQKHYHELPVIAYHEFLRFLRQLYFVFTGNDFDLLKAGLPTLSSVKQDLARISKDHKQMLFDETMVHATYSFERYMLACIREGNPAKLTRHLGNQMPGNEGVLSQGDPLRQAKNMFIVAVTITTRAAIEGGLNPEIAMSLSDLFIQQVEMLVDTQQILACQAEMLMDFTRRVEALNLGDRYSKAVTECCQYIQEHVHQNIRVGDLASHVHLSENYISAKFKEETGQSITGYIKRAKIAEAKSLLRFTGLTLSEISALLSYSSQSFFTTAFKQETGITPNQYRLRGEEAVSDA